MNPQMFNSFLDGTKSGIEMAAVANATGLMRVVKGVYISPEDYALVGKTPVGIQSRQPLSK